MKAVMIQEVTGGYVVSKIGTENTTEICHSKYEAIEIAEKYLNEEEKKK